MTDVSERCRLCEAASESTSESRHPSTIANQHLISSAHFVVVPALGPLSVGHVLVVSKEHASSIASLGEAALEEYEQLAEQIRQKLPFRTTGGIEIEHGSTSSDCAGACIVHAHVHWLPGLGEFESMFEGVVPTLAESDSIGILATVEQPYLLLRGPSRRVHVYDGAGIPSQFARQTICSSLGRDDWDWRENHRLDWVTETVGLWQRESQI